MNQREMLMKHFEACASISNVEAQAIYKIRALPRRICDLEERGWQFSKEWRKDPTGQRYRRYTLIKKGNN
jgi:hypothetical protein|tara:strand:- start:139 stop:348 length:210 start_codon:yes stop_codon:yes gene_type:complete